MRKTNLLYILCVLLFGGCEENNLPPQNPFISNLTVVNITERTATCTFIVNPTSAIQRVGIAYGTAPSQLSENESTSVIIGNTFTLQLTNLVDNQVYYAKAYAIDKMGAQIYSEVISEFQTKTSPNGSKFTDGIIPAASFGGGNGTQNNPYLIANAVQLKKMVDDANTARGYANVYFKLITDIEVTADEWIPIDGFSGNFDGNDHTISGTLQSNKSAVFGFFGSVSNAQISNLTITAAVSNGVQIAQWPSYTGALIGRSVEGSIISDCHITGSVKGGVSLTHTNLTGGVAGEIRNGSILNCTVAGRITGGSFARIGTGGIVGGITESEIINCSVLSSAAITGSEIASTATGGIAASSQGSIKIVNCTNAAAVSGGMDVGGIIGHFSSGTIHTSLNTGNISGSDGVTGGLAGRNTGLNAGDNPRIFSCCTNLGSVNGRPANADNQIGQGKPVESCPDGHTKR